MKNGSPYMMQNMGTSLEKYSTEDAQKTGLKDKKYSKNPKKSRKKSVFKIFFRHLNL